MRGYKPLGEGMARIVMKFGGTSVADVERLRNVADRVAKSAREGNEIAVVWINFDLVAIEQSLEFVRGSHRQTLYNGSAFDAEDDTQPIYGEGLPRLPDIQAERDDWDIISWAVA